MIVETRFGLRAGREIDASASIKLTIGVDLIASKILVDAILEEEPD